MAPSTSTQSRSPVPQVSDFNNALISLNILPTKFDQVDINLWNEPALPTSPPTHLLTYLTSKCADYVCGKYTDGLLLSAFCEDFEGWDETTFARISPDFKRVLKTTLREGGVYTGRINGGMSKQLAELLQNQEPLEWDDKELAEQELSPRSIWYERKVQLKNKTLGTQHITNQKGPQNAAGTTSQTAPPAQTTAQDTIPPSGGMGDGGIGQQQTNRSQIQGSTVKTVTHNPYRDLPPQNIPNEPLDLTTATNFSKGWRNENMFKGDLYDVFDDKVRIFLKACLSGHIEPSQFHAVFPRILAGRAEQYHVAYVDTEDTFAVAYGKLKVYFDTDANHQLYHKDWHLIEFTTTKREHPDKSPTEALELMFDKLQLCQRALGPAYAGNIPLRSQIIHACQRSPELAAALNKPAANPEEMKADLRATLAQYTAMNSQFIADADDQYYLDRRYNNNHDRSRGRDNNRGGSFDRGGRGGFRRNNFGQRDKPWKKRCYICRKEGCWSTKHTDEERRRMRSQYLTQCEVVGTAPTYNNLAAFLMDFEGHEGHEEGDHYILDEDDDDVGKAITNGEDAQYITHLTDQAFLHHLTTQDIYSVKDNRTPATQFLIEDRYSRLTFQGILPDTGAANVSTAGREQLLALQREDPRVELDKQTAGQASIKFGKGSSVTSIGTTTVKTPIGTITFHVLDTPTPFLLCLADMDRLGVYLDNTRDELVCGTTRVPVIRKWGHPWFYLNRMESATLFMSETELRRLHRRFGHPAVNRLHQLLTKANHDVDYDVLASISRFCHHCQVNDSAPHRFKFTLRDDVNFNYEVIVDVMSIEGKSVLHVVDAATAFQGARFLPTMSAKDTWETLKMLWIDTYQGPPDIITHDAGTNFASVEFKSEAKLMGIRCKQVPVEAHHSIGKVERYHAPLRRAFEILFAELSSIMKIDSILQMAVKAVNDTAGPNGLVPTLLVFGAYPRINSDSQPSPTMIKRAEAIQKAMKELRRLRAERQVSDALNTRNGPEVTDTINLPLQSEVRVWREKNGWQGPYKILAIDGHNVTLDMVNGPTIFRSTVIKPYHRDPDEGEDDLTPRLDQSKEAHQEGENQAGPHPEDEDQAEHGTDATIRPPRQARIEAPQPRRRGRPAGSKNKPKVAAALPTAFMAKREADDLQLALKLRNEGVITSPGAPFEGSDAIEIDDLVNRGVFSFEKYDKARHGGTHIFGSRMVREIKGKTTIKPYEKSRLVIAGYNDEEKHSLLTQSPTIQRMSQRIILSLTPTLIETHDMTLSLRDITQAYTHSETTLDRLVLAKLPVELKEKYPEGTIMRVIKPLYGIAESGVHWWTTYQNHHRDLLGMTTSSFDPCLLITDTDKAGKDGFGIVGMQTDDTLILSTATFSAKEEEKLEQAKFRAKPKTILTEGSPFDFNGARLYRDGKDISLLQKGQGAKLATVPKGSDSAQRYIEQRARGAYIASICQPEASFDMSTAAQAQQPDGADCDKLNLRIQWQKDNLERGLRYIPLDLATAKVMVFTDGSFANNKDLSSQIGFVLMIANEDADDSACFTIHGNLIHWSSTKCKRVTRSVLASEIYGMASGFDTALSVSTTLGMVVAQLGLPALPLIVCTDSRSLYECLVKLGTTKEKRLMIDIMAFRQSYERREITEVRWIHGDDNPADAMTKATPNKSLQRFIDNNALTIRVEGFVQRQEEQKKKALA